MYANWALRASWWLSGQCKRWGFHPWTGNFPWTKKWQPTPVFLPRKFYEQRNLVDYSRWSHKVGHDWVCTHTHTAHVTPWAVAHQVPLFIEFSREEYWCGLPFPSPGGLPSSGMEPMSLTSAGWFFTSWAAEPPVSLQNSVCMQL